MKAGSPSFSAFGFPCMHKTHRYTQARLVCSSVPVRCSPRTQPGVAPARDTPLHTRGRPGTFSRLLLTPAFLEYNYFRPPPPRLRAPLLSSSGRNLPLRIFSLPYAEILLTGESAWLLLSGGERQEAAPRRAEAGKATGEQVSPKRLWSSWLFRAGEGRGGK